MSDLIDAPSAGENAPEFSVSEISGAVKRTIEGAFSRVRVKGEIGRVSKPYSGHIYFDLKDDKSVLASVAWKGVAARLRTLPEEGMEVVATGRITTFGAQSKYQLIIDDIAPAGVGALMVMLEKRRKALAAEGLFSDARKKHLPYLPEVIGVITSPSGAVIRDILHRLRDRFPRQVLLWPVVVQGDKCAGEVAQAIAGFNAMGRDGPIPRPDVLIVARGGGSIEDLWGFNEEIAVRAVAQSDIPVISAVGHETDTTLIDFAADVRAPTPTAAAELAVPVRVDLLAALAGLEERRIAGQAKSLRQRGERLRDIARALPRPESLLHERAQRYDALGERLPRALSALGQRRRVELGEKTGRFSPALLRSGLQLRREKLTALTRGISTQRASQNLRDAGTKLVPLTRAFETAMTSRLRETRDRFQTLERLRETMGYKATLKRGYAVVRDGASGAPLPDMKTAQKAGIYEIEFRDGRLPIGADVRSDEPKPKKPAQKKTPKDDQGSLF